MDATTLTTFINEVGFPIVVCIALFYTQRESTKNMVKILDEFKEVIKDHTKALNNIIKRGGDDV